MAEATITVQLVSRRLFYLHFRSVARELEDERT